MNTKSFWSTALVSVALAAGLSACGGGDQDEVEASTTSGVVRGSISGNTLRYLGIPYAAPPVGARRWAAPAAVTPWSGVREAKAFGPHCAQPGTAFGAASTSEDCLYLNVYAPKTPGNYPVMVWIHGGAFYLGLSNGYNPERLVAQGNVVVTLNYRLGALGFMAHPQLSAEQSGASGNYGLMDQQAALRWVRDNIAGFGGNRNNVTIFGESAGGFSVHAHLASPGSTGLFHKAIIQSGAYAFSAAAQPSLATSEAVGTAVGAANGCTGANNTAACLRNIPVASLLASQSVAWPSGPIPSVDTSVLPGSVYARIAAGTYNRVPLIQGATRDEWRLFVALDEVSAPTGAKPYLGAPLNAGNYEAAITGTFPYLAAAPFPAGFPNTLATTVYNPALFGGNHSVALGALGTDLLFACNSRLSSKLQEANASVYVYEFADDTVPAFIPGRSFPMGAAHTTELNYIFDTGSFTRTAAQDALAATIVSQWSRFAATGNPNPPAAPTAWPAFGATDEILQYTPTGTTLIPDATFSGTHRCSALWTPGV
ncbi:MAG TPA: carboxylesterase family protein [Rhizobacter sp.]